MLTEGRMASLTSDIYVHFFFTSSKKLRRSKRFSSGDRKSHRQLTFGSIREAPKQCSWFVVGCCLTGNVSLIGLEISAAFGAGVPTRRRWSTAARARCTAPPTSNWWPRRAWNTWATRTGRPTAGTPRVGIKKKHSSRLHFVSIHMAGIQIFLTISKIVFHCIC